MSAPITINVARSAASVSLSESPSSPRLYVPIHKRTSSSSRPASPSSTDAPHVYSIATLLSLQPLADESMKGKIRVNCPEVVMTRKMRKGVGFNNGRRSEVLLVVPPVTGVKDTNTNTMLTTILPAPTPAPLRVVAPLLPRRSTRQQPGRAPERRRNAFVSTFGARRTGGENSWRLHEAVPMSPVLLA